MFRLAGIMQGIMKRYVDGTAASAQALENGKGAARWRKWPGNSRNAQAPERKPMDFDYSDRCKELQTRLLAFMDEHIYPNEQAFKQKSTATARRATAGCRPNWSNA
jgi:hypothetical protein